jgi:hypothetical protein
MHVMRTSASGTWPTILAALNMSANDPKQTLGKWRSRVPALKATASPRRRIYVICGEACAVRFRAAEADVTPWQAIINGLRPLLQDIWRGLAVQELATP